MSHTIEIINYAFTCVFIVEAIVKVRTSLRACLQFTNLLCMERVQQFGCKCRSGNTEHGVL